MNEKAEQISAGGKYLERPWTPCNLLSGVSSPGQQICRLQVNIIQSWKKREKLFIAELEWSLDDKDTANVMEARSVLDSLDIDNDLEVFQFKVSLLCFWALDCIFVLPGLRQRLHQILSLLTRLLDSSEMKKIVLILIRSSGLVEVWYKTWGLFWWIDSVY